MVAGATEREQHKPRRPTIDELAAHARADAHHAVGAEHMCDTIDEQHELALEHNVERLAEDHEHAQRLARGWLAAGLPVDVERVQTNFVQLDVGALGLSSPEALARLERDAGVQLSPTVRAGVVRAVTHLDISDDDIEHAVARVPAALGAALALGA